MLTISNLHAAIGENEILKGIDLSVRPGEVHAIMGPNGSGKSTLAHVLAGRPDYHVTQGTVVYNEKNLLELEPEERAGEGVFLAFQYPVEIPGVDNLYFLKSAYNAIRRYRGEAEVDSFDFFDVIRGKLDLLHLEESLLKRDLNHGFSGGEKKRNEIFHMAVLEPSLVVLDETDSGLDVDAMKAVAEGVNSLRSPDRAFVVITHYQRLLEHIVPDVVHVLHKGRIAKTGGKELAMELDRDGYGWLDNATTAG